MQLYSFDIMDTLITRKTATPQGIFAIMQEELLNNPEYFDIPKFIREDFFDTRIRAEQYMLQYNTQVKGYEESTFDEIYEKLQNNYNISKEAVNKLKKLELNLEYENIIPICENIERLRQLVTNGEKVVLISDMYHSSETLRSWLVKYDDIFKNIEIYVSSEYCCKKHNGKLYELLKEKLNISYENWHHFGDNVIGDYQQAKKLGINAELYDYRGLKPYEAEAIKSFRKNVKVQKMIGLSKILRLHSNNEKFQLGASLVGQLFVPYVMWVIQDALNKGFRTLYFIARDGYVLKEIADIIIEELKLDIKTKYIYGSRLAWRVPAMLNDKEILKRIILQNCRLAGLAACLDISEEELSQFLPDSGAFPKDNLLRLEFAEQLVANNDFIDFLRQKHSKQIIHASTEYLKQEIDFSKDDFAFVDLNGSGLSVEAVASLVNYENKLNYYVYISNGYKIPIYRCNVYTYLVCKGNGFWAVELLGRAPHGQTLGYKFNEQSQKYEPILEDCQFDFEKWDFESYLQGVKSYAKLLCDNNDLILDLPICLLFYYFNWLKRIDKETIKLIGDIPFASSGKSENLAIEAIKFTDAFLSWLGFKKIRVNFYKQCYEISPKRVRRILDWIAKYNNIMYWFLFCKINKSQNKAYIRICGIEISFKKLLGWR